MIEYFKMKKNDGFWKLLFIWERSDFKGIVQAKVKNLSLFSHSHAVSNPY